MAAKSIGARAGRVIQPLHEAHDPEGIRRGTIIERLQRTLEDEETFRLFPTWLAQVLEEKIWQSFRNPTTNELHTFHNFEDFVRARRTRGLGIAGGVEYLYRECRFYAELGNEAAMAALAKLREMMPAAPPEDEAQAEAGAKGGRGHKGSDNVTPFSSRGNSETYLLRRLKRDRPDLADKVIHREVSAHAAAIEAGFRVRMVQVVPTVEGFRRAAIKHLTEEERDELYGGVG